MNGRKRHLLLDTSGLPITAAAPLGELQNHAAAFLLLCVRQDPRLDHSAHDGEWACWVLHAPGTTSDIVQPSEDAGGTGFTVLSRRWIVERTYAGLPGVAAGPVTTSAFPPSRRHGPMGRHHPDDPPPRPA